MKKKDVEKEAKEVRKRKRAKNKKATRMKTSCILKVKRNSYSVERNSWVKRPKKVNIEEKKRLPKSKKGKKQLENKNSGNSNRDLSFVTIQ